MDTNWLSGLDDLFAERLPEIDRVGGMIKSKVTRFRAYQLGAWVLIFVFCRRAFTVLEARMTEMSSKMLAIEMNHCEVSSANALHITSWDADHCLASELPDLLTLARPLTLNCRVTPVHGQRKEVTPNIAEIRRDRSGDNRTKSYRPLHPNTSEG